MVVYINRLTTVSASLSVSTATHQINTGSQSISPYYKHLPGENCESTIETLQTKFFVIPTVVLFQYRVRRQPSTRPLGWVMLKL